MNLSINQIASFLGTFFVIDSYIYIAIIFFFILLSVTAK